MLAVIFICGNLFLRITGKSAKSAKIRTRKNVLPREYVEWRKKRQVNIKMRKFTMFIKPQWPSL